MIETAGLLIKDFSEDFLTISEDKNENMPEAVIAYHEIK